MLNDGIGTKADPVKAWALATIADERGEADAKKMIVAIESRFDDKQKAAAKKELAEMKADKPAAPPTPAPTPGKPAPVKVTPKPTPDKAN